MLFGGLDQLLEPLDRQLQILVVLLEYLHLLGRPWVRLQLERTHDETAASIQLIAIALGQLLLGVLPTQVRAIVEGALRTQREVDVRAPAWLLPRTAGSRAIALLLLKSSQSSCVILLQVLASFLLDR